MKNPQATITTPVITLASHQDQQLAMQQGVAQQRPALVSLWQRLEVSGTRAIADAQHRLQLAARGLHAVSPLATLDRGYAIVTDAATGKALTRASEVKQGNDIRARLAHGELLAKITGVVDDGD